MEQSHEIRATCELVFAVKHKPCAREDRRARLRIRRLILPSFGILSSVLSMGLGLARDVHLHFVQPPGCGHTDEGSPVAALLKQPADGARVQLVQLPRVLRAEDEESVPGDPGACWQTAAVYNQY